MANGKTRRRSDSYTLGRDQFAKISAVEGIELSARVKKDFNEFERLGLSAEQRRKELRRKYGGKI